MAPPILVSVEMAGKATRAVTATPEAVVVAAEWVPQESLPHQDLTTHIAVAVLGELVQPLTPLASTVLVEEEPLLDQMQVALVVMAAAVTEADQ